MIKTIKNTRNGNLKLHQETVRTMSTPQLTGVVGGSGTSFGNLSNYTSCFTSNQTCCEM